MKKTFAIYPALFILTPGSGDAIIGNSREQLMVGKRNFKVQDNYFINGGPQMYYGDCLLNDDHTMITILFRHPVVQHECIDIPETLFTKLETETFKGKNYTLTYISVMN